MIGISGVYSYSVFFYYVTFTNGETEMMDKNNPLVTEYLKTHDVQEKK